MATSITPPPDPGESGQAPPDLATMRRTISRLLDPDAVPDVLPPAPAELDTLTPLLRGHLALMIGEVEAVADLVPPESVPRYCMLACVGDARARLRAEPGDRYGGPVGHARRMARALKALCDHYESVTRVCRGCGERVTDPDDAVRVGYEESSSGPGRDVWAHQTHTDLAGPNPDGTRIALRALSVQTRRP